nr:DUF2877 domain-containing protein [Dyella sp. ASV24]
MEKHNLPALSVGYLASAMLQQASLFEVHSQFENALNLVTADGEMMTLTGMRAPGFPTTIRVCTPTWWDWRLGGSVRQVGHVSSVLHHAAWSVDLSRAECWVPDGRDIEPSWAALSTERLSVLETALRDHLDQTGARSALCLYENHSSVALTPTITWHDDVTQIEAQVVRLIGFGFGLTPDGDDFLLGYMAALSPWRRYLDISAHLREVGAIVRRHLHRTTDISRHYLKLATDGHFSEPVLQLAAAIAGGDSHTSLQRLAENVLRFGASSGADCMAGMVHGLKNVRKALDAYPSTPRITRTNEQAA